MKIRIFFCTKLVITVKNVVFHGYLLKMNIHFEHLICSRSYLFLSICLSGAGSFLTTFKASTILVFFICFSMFNRFPSVWILSLASTAACTLYTFRCFSNSFRLAWAQVSQSSMRGGPASCGLRLWWFCSQCSTLLNVHKSLSSQLEALLEFSWRVHVHELWSFLEFPWVTG